MLLRFFALLKMTGAFVCFLDSYLLFFLFGSSNSLRIRGYLIKYPRIFHHVSVDISLRIRGYASFLLCPRDLLVVCFWVFSYWWLVFTHTNLTDLMKYSFIAGFSFTRNGVRRPKGPKAISLISRSFLSSLILVSHRSHESHRWRVASPALVGFAECTHPGGKHER